MVATLEELTKSQNPLNGAMQETWNYVAAIPIKGVYVKQTMEIIKDVRYYKTTTTILTKYPSIKAITNRLVINNNIYVISNVTPGVWYTLTSYTITAC